MGTKSQAKMTTRPMQIDRSVEDAVTNALRLVRTYGKFASHYWALDEHVTIYGPTDQSKKIIVCDLTNKHVLEADISGRRFKLQSFSGVMHTHKSCRDPNTVIKHDTCVWIERTLKREERKALKTLQRKTS